MAYSLPKKLCVYKKLGGELNDTMIFYVNKKTLGYHDKYQIITNNLKYILDIIIFLL